MVPAMPVTRPCPDIGLPFAQVWYILQEAAEPVTIVAVVRVSSGSIPSGSVASRFPPFVWAKTSETSEMAGPWRSLQMRKA